MSRLPEVEGFELRRSLGRGAAAEVFLARETSGLQRLVALKLFFPHQESWFETELEVLRQVEELRRRERAPQLIQSLGSGRWQGGGWIAFEFQEGGSLADTVQREGPLALQRALALLLAAAEGVALLHAEGLFHRDLKPSNILLAGDDNVRLADFGLTQALDQTATAAGSPAFCAPEVIAGRRDSDGRRVDIYGLGATLYYLLLGETMLPGRPDVFALERIGLPRPLQQVLCRAAAAEPRERPADVAELCALLRAAACEKNSRTLSKSAAVRVDADHKEVSPVQTFTEERRARSLGLIVIIVVLIGFILLVGMGLVGAGFYWFKATQSSAAGQMQAEEMMAVGEEGTDSFWNVPSEWAEDPEGWQQSDAYRDRRDAAQKLLQQWAAADPQVVNVAVLTEDGRQFLISAHPASSFALRDLVELESGPLQRSFTALAALDERLIPVRGMETRLAGDGAPGSPAFVIYQVLMKD